MNIRVENGNLLASPSCELCTHKDVCKFYSKAKELFSSNEFYGMNEYLEWNNNLKAWSENKSCQFYTPFLFDKKLFIKETKKNNSYINAHHWSDIVTQHFNETKRDKYLDYIESERAKYRQKDSYKNMTDEELERFLYQKSSSSGFIFTVGANDKSWEEQFNLIDMLEYFNAFKEI